MPNEFPEAGTLIGGVYRVLGLLGTGAMGVVLEAEDESLGRRVAIKFIHGNLIDDGFRERFRTEAQAMARVSHANVVQIYAYGEHLGAPYFVMEHVHGVTLDEWAAEPGSDALESILGVLGQLCDGVAAIHVAGAVHRDLKPRNVLVDMSGRARVADLGLAVLQGSEASVKREVVGTPGYMAPETAFPSEEARTSGERADVYSIGCIAYELLAGSPPFIAPTPVAMMFQHLSTTPDLPSERRPELPKVFDDVILRAIAKKPEDRFQTVASLGQALRAASEGLVEPMRILIAEDNDDFREAVEISLGLAFPGAVIDCVSNGRQALEAFDQARPSVAILDLAMPELDGMELTGLLRARDAETPIIVVTASGGPADWKRLSAMGVDRFLVKPVVLDDVVETVRRVLKERRGGRRPSQG